MHGRPLPQSITPTSTHRIHLGRLISVTTQCEVYHINSVFCPEVIAAVQPPWKSKGRTLHAPESATIADAVDSFGYQVTSAVVCPRDGEQGCAYVDTLTSRDDVGRAVALLSCELPSHWSFLCLDDDVPLMV